MVSVVNIAIIICGSRGFNNYRHQADLYSWMKVLQNRGFERRNIISFSYNDLPELTNNTIYHTCHGNNVYQDDAVNYSFLDANKDNILRTIRKVSGKNVNLLVVYINHGAYNMLSTPNTADQPIYVDDFAEALNECAGKVRKICCVIEACYSGSMASRARYAKNIIFITAADAKQASYSYSWCPELKAYTTDEFTYHLLNYLDDKGNDGKYLQDMVKDVKGAVKLSNVVASGGMYRVLVKEFFGYIGRKRSGGILGDVSVDTVKRVKNTVAPTSRLKRIYQRVKLCLYRRHNMTYEPPLMRYWKGTDSGYRKDVDTVKMIKQPDVEERCYKQVGRAAFHIFLNRYLEEDNIEFLHDMGLLCLNFTGKEVVEVMTEVAEWLDGMDGSDGAVKQDALNGYLKDKTVEDVSGAADVDISDDVTDTDQHERRHKIMQLSDKVERLNSIVSQLTGAVEQAISIQRPGRPGRYDEDSDDEPTDVPSPTPSPTPYRYFRNGAKNIHPGYVRPHHKHMFRRRGGQLNGHHRHTGQHEHQQHPFADTPAQERVEYDA